MVSVVVPTRDRPEALRRCLGALARQTIIDTLEVVVVDDGSAEGAAVAEVVAEHSFARLVRMEASGPASARNAGAASAFADVLCFTDDDCMPEAAWAERLAWAIHAGADAAAGVTYSANSGRALETAWELVASAPVSTVGSGSSPEYLSFAPSNNLACRADLLRAIPFDETFRAAAGEDREWCARVNAAGYVLRREPAAGLVHGSEPTLRAFLRQQVRYGRGAFLFRRGGRTRRRLEGPGFYIGLVRRGFRHGFTTGLLVTAAQAATALGFLLEAAAARRR